MTRGEIWWVDFGIPFGSEVGFRRPVIILQNNVLNESKLRTVVVLPLTTNLEYGEFPNNVFLSRKFSGLPKDSVTQSHLIIHIDKERLLEKVCKLNDSVLENVLKGVIKTIS